MLPKYPYTNFHELNLDWILQVLKKFDGNMTEAFKEWLDENMGTLITDAVYDPVTQQITLTDTDTPSSIGGYVKQFAIGDETSVPIYVRDDTAVHTDELNGAGKIVRVTAIKDPAVTDYGDNFLIEDDENVYMVDLGNEASYLADYLDSIGINHIDRLIITHFHLDHIGGGSYSGPVYNFIQLFGDPRIDWTGTVIYMPHAGIDYTAFQGGTVVSGRASAAQTAFENAAVAAGAQLVYPIEGQKVSFSDRVNVEFHNIGSAFYTNYYGYMIRMDGTIDSETIYNNFCMLSVFNILGKSAVFFGDAQELAQQLNAEFIQGAYFLAVPHHGTNLYGSHEFCSALNTAYAVVGNRAANAHIGTVETERISAIGGQVYDTFNGPQVFTFTAGSIIADEPPVLFYHADYYAGSIIVENGDLDDYTEPGIYFSPSGTRTQTLSNKPPFATNMSFRLDVVSTSRTLGAVIQIAIKSNTERPEICIRTRTGNAVWSEWRMMRGDAPLDDSVSFETGITGSRLSCKRVSSMVWVTAELLTTAEIPAGTVMTIAGLSVNPAEARAYHQDVGSDGVNRRFYTVSTGGNVEIRSNAVIPSGTTCHVNLTFAI